MNERGSILVETLIATAILAMILAAAFQTHGAELFSGGGSVSCIVVSNTATRDRAGSMDGGVRLNPLEAREVQSNALASDLRADAPTFGAYDPMESLARGFA